MPDELETKINEILTVKLDAALKPLLEQIKTLTPKEEPEADADNTEKTDADKKLARAAEILRSNLKGYLKKEKIDAMTFDELDIANQLKDELPQSGIKNPVEQKKPKLDSNPDEWGCEVQT